MEWGMISEESVFMEEIPDRYLENYEYFKSGKYHKDIYGEKCFGGCLYRYRGYG